MNSQVFPSPSPGYADPVPDVPQVTVRVAPPLRFLLPSRDRSAGQRRLRFSPDATIGHLVQAAGVPLTEAGDLKLDGLPVDVAARPGPGGLVDVDPAARPETVPPGGFLLDVGLGALARRLRLLGLDAAWSADADDPELVTRAAAEDRVLLTQDRGLLMRRALGRAGRARGALIRGSRPDDQLADVMERFSPGVRPFTRCTACGDVLVQVPKADVAERLPQGTRRSYDDFARCRTCRRVYWQGAHAPRIRALVAGATLGGTTEETDRGAPRR
jgi:uncharacterized protein with PIN domain